MTFSIAARDGDAWGVAVASKFLAVGSVVPAVRAGCRSGGHAVAGPGGVPRRGPGRPRRGHRRRLPPCVMPSPPTRAARCARSARSGRPAPRPSPATTASPWAGGVAAGDEHSAYAIQGNILTGPEVAEAMEAAWLGSAGQRLDHRLIATVLAGDDAGGDSRGRQSAAILAHAPGAGYDACGVLADLRVDDHPDAPRELARLHDLSTLLFGGPEDVEPLDGRAARRGRRAPRRLWGAAAPTSRRGSTPGCPRSTSRTGAPPAASTPACSTELRAAACR